MAIRKTDQRSASARRATQTAKALPALTEADYQALGAFRLALRRFLAFSESGARALGLTSQQHQALLAIRSHPGPGPISVGVLAEILLVKNHSALGMVGRLAELGLVRRAEAEDDRRRVVLFLTAKGERSLETISRNNLGELRGSAEALRDVLEAAKRLGDVAP